jgi:peptidoglycan/LPS O-acetylase OafA/YrhL
MHFDSIDSQRDFRHTDDRVPAVGESVVVASTNVGVDGKPDICHCMKNERFQVLNGWRGICALLVALFHLNAYGHFYELPLIRGAWLAVDFFFVLSGFIISYRYIDRLGSLLEIRSFIIRRFGRLWPLQASVLMVFVGLELVRLVLLKFGAFSADQAAFSNNTLSSLSTNLFLVHSLGVHDRLTWNAPSWSISTEFYTYLFFAAFVLLFRNSSRFIALSTGIAVLSCAIVFSFSEKAMDTTYDFGIFRCLYGFFVGHLTYCLWKSNRVSHFFSDGWLYLEIAALISFIAILSVAGKAQWSFAAPLVFAFVVWAFAHERGPISRLMKMGALMSLGVWSYSIYMVHYLLLYVFALGASILTKLTNLTFTTKLSYPWLDGPAELFYFGDKWTGDGFAIVYLASVIFLAAITYSMVEQPGRRFFNSLAWAQASKPLALIDPENSDCSQEHVRPKQSVPRRLRHMSVDCARLDD